MKNYKVKVLYDFDDIEEQCHRNIDDIFNCTKERFLYLQEHNAVELIEIEKIEEEPTNIEQKSNKKVATKRAKK